MSPFCWSIGKFRKYFSYGNFVFEYGMKVIHWYMDCSCHVWGKALKNQLKPGIMELFCFCWYLFLVVINSLLLPILSWLLLSNVARVPSMIRADPSLLRVIVELETGRPRFI